MAGIKDSQREERIIQVLGFIFLFKVVMVKDLDLLGSSVLGINSMRRTVEYLKRRKMIDRFVTSTPMKTSGYWLLEAGLKRLPKSLLRYDYKFAPAWFSPGRLVHNSGVIEVCLLCQRLVNYGHWVSEWMIRQDRIKRAGQKIVTGSHGRIVKSAARGRLPDGFFVVTTGVKIAVEFEATRKNIHDWADMIRDLEYGLNDRKKIDPDTNSIVTGKDFEAVLFVFNEDVTMRLYRKRFDEYSSARQGAGVHKKRELVVLSPQCFFLTTLDELKKGKVYSGMREINFIAFLEIVKSLHHGAVNEKMVAVA